MRELEQAVRRILVTGRYAGDSTPAAGAGDEFLERVRAGDIAAEEMLAQYCSLLHRRHGAYEEVARRTGLDRRTAKKYVEAARSPEE